MRVNTTVVDGAGRRGHRGRVRRRSIHSDSGRFVPDDTPAVAGAFVPITGRAGRQLMPRSLVGPVVGQPAWRPRTFNP